MRRPLSGAMILLSVAFASTLAHAAPVAPGSNDTLSFELWTPTGQPIAIYGNPPGSFRRDTLDVHGGRSSVRLEGTASGRESFSNVGATLPITFAGDSIEIRGWLKTDAVVGFGGLWLREDGQDGPVQFDNMASRGLAGTTPWTEHRIVLPLDRKARSVVFGALLVGTGTLRADDLELRVDGKPLAQAKALVRDSTAVERDHEFDRGSGVTDTLVSARQIQNLVLLGKVWGFVKYHHPSVTGAMINWDYELFRVLPRVLAAKDAGAARVEISRWLARIGDPPACKPCASLPESIMMQPRVDWVRDRARLGTELSERLVRIHTNRHATGNQHYAHRPLQSAGNINFSNEAPYPHLGPGHPALDPGYRLLAVYRFWNIVEYWFPYRDLIPGSWDDVLATFIPRAMVATTDREYRLALLALVARARDGHANLWSAMDTRPPRGPCQLPIAVRSAEGRFVVGAFADSVLGARSGLQVGDAILALDGLPVDSLAATWAQYYGVSNESARRREISRQLTRGECGPCRVTIERAGQRLDVTADRAQAQGMNSSAGMTHDRPGDGFQLLTPEIAYLKLSGVAQQETRSYVERARGTRCFVIDIRNYPKEFVPFALGQHLVERSTSFVRFTLADLANPGMFRWTPPLAIDPQAPRYEGQVVILVDETSISQAEYTTMALHMAPGAIVVGSTTAGADGNISNIPMPGGQRAAISGLGVFYPDRRPTQQIGIVPDLVVEPTIAGIRAGRDEVLEAAIEKALGRKVPIPAP